MNEERENKIAAVIGELHELMNEYHEGRCKAEYGFECDSMMLGALMKGLNQIELYKPCIQPPFVAVSLESIIADMRKMRVPIYDILGYQHQSCDFQDQIEPLLISLFNDMEGFNLESV
jgi:hypothetical protein